MRKIMSFLGTITISASGNIYLINNINSGLHSENSIKLNTNKYELRIPHIVKENNYHLKYNEVKNENIKPTSFNISVTKSNNIYDFIII